jgi:MoaA/NifB/PqqE/SkfB family radical SAM enzyme
MKREKKHIEHDVYLKALKWAKFFVNKYGQRELNLAGIGESTMHPRFAEYVGLAREAVGWNCDLILATNGLLITDKLVKEILPFKPKVWVSAHRPEKAGPAVEILKKYGLFVTISSDPTVAAIDWAGQVDWHVSAPPMGCTWLPSGKVFVSSNGDLMPCCLDGDGVGIFGNIMQDDLLSLKTQDYDLCRNCNMKIVINNEVVNYG